MTTDADAELIARYGLTPADAVEATDAALIARYGLTVEGEEPAPQASMDQAVARARGTSVPALSYRGGPRPPAPDLDMANRFMANLYPQGPAREQALAQAGRLGLPYLASPMETMERLEGNYGRHGEAAAEAGHGAIDTVPVMRTIFLTRSERQGRELRDHGLAPPQWRRLLAAPAM